MIDNKSISWTWTELINEVPDAEEVLSSIFNEENLQEIQSQQSTPPPPPHHENTINVGDQTRTKFMNELGFPNYYYYQPKMLAVPAQQNCSLRKLSQSEYKHVTPSGRKREILLEETEEERKKKNILIKNRAAAARSRARKLERIKFLEEQVEALKEENAKLKRIILEGTLRMRRQKIQVEMIKEKTAKKSLRRTVSSLW